MTQTKTSRVEQKDAVNLLYSNSGMGLVISVFAASVLVFSFPSSAAIQSIKYAWWGLICVTALLRFMDLIYFFSSARHQDSFAHGRARARFAAGALFTGSLWSAYAVFTVLMWQASWAEIAVTCIVIAAFSGGSVSLLSAGRRLSIVYSVILTLPLAIVLLISPNEDYFGILGLLSLAFCIVMGLGANNAGRFTSRAIHLKHQNDHLLSHMEQEVNKRTQEIYSLSNIDPLTGLYNRKAFAENLSYRLSTQPNTRLAVLFIDLDGFKTINDTLGHKAGDQVIKEAGQRIKQVTQDKDLLCRWGGDEFLLTINQSDTLLNNAQEIIDLIALPYVVDGSKLSIGATIGVAYYPQHGNDHERLIQRADMAMYNQKRAEKGRVGVFDESLRDQLMREIRLRDHLENAVHRHELSLVYQPIVDSTTGQIASVEALLRWTLDDERIPPDEFIAIAEQYGFIRSIGIWVLGEACLAGKRMQAHHQDLGMCVNVSIQQLLDNDFPNEVAAVLKRTGFAPNKLDLEITESLFAHDKRRMINNIKRLKDLGIKVSIDDFGTGYSSLSVMQEFDVDYVKIDRSFVWSMDTGGKAIVEAVSQIATAFDYKVIAEGVETDEQRQLLTSMGIDYLQGYWFLPPVQEQQLIEHLPSIKPN
ncbi:putative bifunctional diguanylate cyclase/phosphodiesterase [Marinomonas ostreistagni]|uniref:putative bifunctional diguanylate cyclase/phosphodiesterase n=1 Tax=Marinomonas ostreistagni TaxID=359209 RepID=UPI0019519662|nr:EAL domain-containing protein [Marinomonas ostreistagni]MBM6550791.1 EAL domain-containing protein [Marinomonas ostreistagni]